ncbi:MAG: TIGR03905 family TSCPD domain-containing protein [Lachnospiraceae bacterium]|nr:TIGR03905 family TSCPD domain-containing protein [Lachnospiraceae bacterium]MDD6505046.1 TIGR03905 family TSCPD domain-containing protein [Lachnospiraceae bacterium]
MKKHVTYKTKGVCSQMIDFDLIDGRVHNIRFTGGCRGNTQGVAALAEGMEAEEVIRRCKGIECRGGNSCPNQLSLAIEQGLQGE